jgi:hypothetical protein
MLPSAGWGAPASAGGTAPTARKADRPRPGGAAPRKSPVFLGRCLVTPSESLTSETSWGFRKE